MPYLALSNGSGHTLTGITYAQLRALLFEKTSTTPAGVTKGPGNPPTWFEFGGTLTQDGQPMTIDPNGIAYLAP